MDPVPRPSKLEAGVAGEAGRPGATPQLEGDMGNFCLRRAAQTGPWASGFKVSFSHCLYKWKRGSSSRGLSNGPAGCPAQPGRGALAANHCPLNAMPLKVSSWETGHWGLGPSCSPMFLLSPQSPELRGETGAADMNLWSFQHWVGLRAISSSQFVLDLAGFQRLNSHIP